MKPLDPVGVDRHFTYCIEIWTDAIGLGATFAIALGGSARVRRLGKVRISAGRQDRAAAKSN